LLSAGALIDQSDALNEAARLGHDRIMQSLLRAGADVNNTTALGEPPLYTACNKGHENVVQTLLQDRNINVNQPDELGRTPLHIAVSREHDAIVSRLLNKPGIDVNHADKDGFTPLFISQIHGYTVIEQALRAHGAIN
jgi:ankyrin repeat protein